MRVMFAVSDYRPHYYPMVPLGWALQAAGHEVRVVCAPGQQRFVDDAGLTPVPILSDVDSLMWVRLGQHLAAAAGDLPTDLGLVPLHPVTGDELASYADFDAQEFFRSVRAETAATMSRRITAMVEFARQWRPGLVVHDTLYLDPVVAAKATGVPAVCHLTGPLGTQETDWGLDVIPQHYSREYDTYGVTERGADLITHVIDVCPASIAPPTAATRLDVRYVPYNGPGAMPKLALREADRPRVAVLWSNTMPKLYGARSFVVPTVLDALADLDLDVVLTMNAEAGRQLTALPDNVTLLDHCPVHTLLPSCDALLHNGGAGATLTAITAGVPQLFVTFGPEYRLNARRVSATGAGVVLDGTGVAADDIRKSMLALVEDPAYAQRAAVLRAESQDRPSPAELVHTLERLAGGASCA